MAREPESCGAVGDGIMGLTIGPALLIQRFGPGEVDERPQFGLFFLSPRACRNQPARIDG